jgi:hypothetical protein
MAFVTPAQQAFNAGLWGLSASGRADLKPYRQALSKCLNFIPRVTGSLAKRPGTKFVSEVKDSSKKVKLVPFIFDRTTSYMLEFGDFYLRVYKDGALLPVIDGGSSDTITTPWAVADLFELNWAQDADTLVVTHADYQPRLLQRASESSWSISALEFEWGPYLNRGESYPNVYPKDGTLGVKVGIDRGSVRDYRTNPITDTVRAEADVFEAGRDEGRIIVIGDGDLDNTNGESFCVGTINTVSSPTVCTVDFYDGRYDSGTAGTQYTFSWWMQAYWEQGSYAVWPSVCTFYQERLILGGGNAMPDRAWASRLGSITDFDSWAYTDAPPPTGGVHNPNIEQHEVLDTSAIPIGLSYPELNMIQWVRSSKNSLLFGTTRAVFVAQTPATEGFSPNSNIQVRSTAATGSTQLPAVNVNEQVSFVSQDRDNLVRIGFSLEADSFIPSDLNRFNADVLRPAAMDISVAFSPEPIIWLCTSDGRLVGCTLDDQQSVLAWHEHKLGGVGVDQTWAEVESVSVIPSLDETYDELWLVVRRTINGQEKRYVEFMTRELRSDENREDQRYVDCHGEPYSGVSTTTYSSLTHLPGETVDVLADGAAEAQKVVSAGGAITLEEGAEEIVAGLSYLSEAHTMPIVVNDPQGGSMAKRHRVSELYLRLSRSSAGELAAGHPDQLVYRPISYRQTQDPMDSGPPLFTGVLKERSLSEVSLEPVLATRHQSPVNFEVLVFGAYMDASSR